MSNRHVRLGRKHSSSCDRSDIGTLPRMPGDARPSLSRPSPTDAGICSLLLSTSPPPSSMQRVSLMRAPAVASRVVLLLVMQASSLAQHKGTQQCTNWRHTSGQASPAAVVVVRTHSAAMHSVLSQHMQCSPALQCRSTTEAPHLPPKSVLCMRLYASRPPRTEGYPTLPSPAPALQMGPSLLSSGILCSMGSAVRSAPGVTWA